ncbi:MAG: DUF2993 domain-containing protein, partial [Nakamurella sp.]
VISDGVTPERVVPERVVPERVVPERATPDDSRRGAAPRPLRTTAVAMLVVAGLVVLIIGSDWLARVGSQTLLTQQIQDATGSTNPPGVAISGTWFLPQVIRGHYDTVDIDLAAVSSGPLTLTDLHATLTGVHLPFHDVLVRNVDRVVIDSATEEAMLTYDDLNSFLSTTGRRVSVQPVSDGVVTLTGTVDVLGKSVSASADAAISSKDGALTLSPVRLRTDTVLDRASESLLGQRFTLIVPLDPLPFGQVITEIRPQADGFHIRAGGVGVIVDP